MYLGLAEGEFSTTPNYLETRTTWIEKPLQLCLENEETKKETLFRTAAP